MYKYYPELREKLNLASSILFLALESEFTGRTHLQLSKRTLKNALRFTTNEINSAFNQLVKQYKSITQYKDSDNKFDGYLYCCYVTQGRGKSARVTHIFRNGQSVNELLQSIELANRKSVIASSTCLSTREVEKMPGTITGQDSWVNSESLQSIELANRKSVIASSTCLSTREMAETIVESQQKPLQSIELANSKSVIASSTRLSSEKGHPYRDINNNIIYILSLEESERVEQMNQEDQDIKNTPPTPPPLVRAVDPMKGTEKSHGSDPWMKTSNNPDPDFAKWVWKQNKLKRDTATLADAKAEIRNSWVRAQDLWEDYQSDQADQTPTLPTKVVEPRPELPPASVPVFDPVAFRQKLAAKINKMEKD